MLQGVSLIVKESLSRGEVQEITVTEGIMILRRSIKHPIACVLVADKSTKSLRHALDIFAAKFFNDYASFFDDPTRIDVFRGASTLISECFPFVPDYA